MRCWHLRSVCVEANWCLAVLAASGLPLMLGEAAPSYAGKLHLLPGCSFQQLPHTRSLRLGSCQEWAASYDCSGVALLPLLLHRPSSLCQLFQVFPPTSCLHLLGIPVPAACLAIKQHVLRAGCQGPAVPPWRRWDPLLGSQHWFLPPSSHPASRIVHLLPFPSPSPGHHPIQSHTASMGPGALLVTVSALARKHGQSTAPRATAWWEMA